MNKSHKSINFSRVIRIIREGRLRYYLKKLLWIDKDHRKISTSMTLGVFIGVFIPVGFQTIVTIPVGLLLKRNIFVAVLFTMISNPLTVLPLYYLSFKIGEYLTGLNITDAQFYQIVEQPGLTSLLNLGKTGVINFFTGSLILAIPISICFYFLSDIMIQYYRNRKSRHN
jgi:uncharacterized protein (DUF2062 family)